MLTHFGPSSNALFANLLVFQSGRPQAIFSDQAFMMEGDEQALEKLASDLYEKNASMLQRLGVESNITSIKNANYVVRLADSKIIRGQVDLENERLIDFQIKNSQSSLCSIALTRTEISVGKALLIHEPEKTNQCLAGPIQLRSIFRTPKNLWFVYLKKLDAMGMSFYTVHIAGLPISHD
jgi:hypothetical protein